MRWIFFIILFFAAIFFGTQIIQDPGYALFVYHDWSIQMPLWIAILLFFVLFLSFYFCMKLFFNFILIGYSLKIWRLKRELREKNAKKI